MNSTRQRKNLCMLFCASVVFCTTVLSVQKLFGVATVTVSYNKNTGEESEAVFSSNKQEGRMAQAQLAADEVSKYSRRVSYPYEVWRRYTDGFYLSRGVCAIVKGVMFQPNTNSRIQIFGVGADAGDTYAARRKAVSDLEYKACGLNGYVLKETVEIYGQTSF